jgi:hypothetical protein
MSSVARFGKGEEEGITMKKMSDSLSILKTTIWSEPTVFQPSKMVTSLIQMKGETQERNWKERRRWAAEGSSAMRSRSKEE